MIIYHVQTQSLECDMERYSIRLMNVYTMETIINSFTLAVRGSTLDVRIWRLQNRSPRWKSKNMYTGYRPIT